MKSEECFIRPSSHRHILPLIHDRGKKLNPASSEEKFLLTKLLTTAPVTELPDNSFSAELTALLPCLHNVGRWLDW